MKSRELMGGCNCRKSKICISLCKNRLRRLTDILIGHCLLRKHSKNVDVVGDTSCTFCGQREKDPCHLLQECDAVSVEWEKRGQQRMEQLTNLEISHILNCLVDLGLWIRYDLILWSKALGQQIRGRWGGGKLILLGPIA